jgi:hypothetical protein
MCSLGCSCHPLESSAPGITDLGRSGGETPLSARTSADVELPIGVAVSVTEVAGYVFGIRAEIEEFIAARVQTAAVGYVEFAERILRRQLSSETGN